MKTGKLRVSHAKTTCSDGFLSIHKEVPYPLPRGLMIEHASNDGWRILGTLLPEVFVTVTTQTMIKYHNSEGLTLEEHCLLGWIHSSLFKHNDGDAEWSVFPIGRIPIVSDADCQCLIIVNGHHHLHLFKMVWMLGSVLFSLYLLFFYCSIMAFTYTML